MGERRFYPELESLRGIAAAMVALMHVLQAPLSLDASTTLMSATWSGLRVLGNGQGGVVFFFVLSGFVLSHQLGRLPGNWSYRCHAFVAGRIFRIYPSVWATLTIFVAIYLVIGAGLTTAAVNFEARSILQDAMLITTHINGVMWTLQTELLAVPVVFLLFIVKHRFGATALIAAFLMFACLSFTGHWNKLLSEIPLLQPMYAFVAGMLAWVTCRRYKGLSGWWLASAGIGFLLTRPLIGWGSSWSMLFESIFAALIIAMLVANPHLGRTAGFTNGVLRYYGRISYSFYLLHPLSLIVIWSIPGPLASAVDFGISPALLCVGLFFASVLVITPIAHLQYLLIERGGVMLGRRLTLRFTG